MGVAIAAFSFGLRKQEPSVGNQQLAAAVLQVHSKHPAALIAAQWEVARGLEQLGTTADLVIQPNSDSTYLDTQQVWDQMVPYLQAHDVSEVIPVAQQFLHLRLVCGMIKKTPGFRVRETSYPAIGFDSSIENTQWWTRSRHALVLYGFGKTLKLPMHEA